MRKILLTLSLLSAILFFFNPAVVAEDVEISVTFSSTYKPQNGVNLTSSATTYGTVRCATASSNRAIVRNTSDLVFTATLEGWSVKSVTLTWRSGYAPASTDVLSVTGGTLNSISSITGSSATVTLSSTTANNNQQVTAVTVVFTSSGSSCSAPTSPSITGTTAYTAGNNISLTASATGTSGTTTYTWYKGANWATASASSPVQAASTSGATFTKASCSMSDAGTYWCNISNGTGCDVQVSQAITVSCKNPTQTFSNSDYTIGGAALNLASKFSSNSSGAVTYSVQNAGGTGASIAGTSFSATTEGTATVRASQAADGDYCAKTIDASVSVAAADCTDPGLTITLN